MRYITEHLTADAAERQANLAGNSVVVTRETLGITYWYVVPAELRRIDADIIIESFARVHLIRGDQLRCRVCALPLDDVGVGDYHADCVPVGAPVDPQLFEVWSS